MKIHVFHKIFFLCLIFIYRNLRKYRSNSPLDSFAKLSGAHVDLCEYLLIRNFLRSFIQRIFHLNGLFTKKDLFYTPQLYLWHLSDFTTFQPWRYQLVMQLWRSMTDSNLIHPGMIFIIAFQSLFMVIGGHTLESIIWLLVDTHKNVIFKFELNHIRLQHLLLLMSSQ